RAPHRARWSDPALLEPDTHERRTLRHPARSVKTTVRGSRYDDVGASARNRGLAGTRRASYAPVSATRASHELLRNRRARITIAASYARNEYCRGERRDEPASGP